MLFKVNSHRTSDPIIKMKKKKRDPGIDKHGLLRFIVGDNTANTASYLQKPSCISSIDTIATGSDIPEFPIVHMHSGENVSL